MVSFGMPAQTKAITKGNPLSCHRSSSPDDGVGPDVVVAEGKRVGVGGANVVTGAAAFASPTGTGKEVVAVGLGGARAAGKPLAIALAAMTKSKCVKVRGRAPARPTYRNTSQLEPKWQQVWTHVHMNVKAG